jgi:cell division septal protein FtsQ
MRDMKPKPVKSARIGANRRMRMNEKRSKRPTVVKRVFAKGVRAALCLALAGAAVYSVFIYGHIISDKVSGAVKSGMRLPASVAITGCSPTVQASLKRAIDSLAPADSSSFDRAGILKAASAIREIEKVVVKRARWASHDRVTQITVTERKPAAIVHNGEIFLVDGNGVCFSPVPGQFYDLPLLAYGGKALGDTVDMETFFAIKRAAKSLGGAFFQELAEIDLSRASEVNLVFRSSDTEYKVAARDVESRLAHVKALRERLADDGSKPLRVDLRYRNLAFATAR